MYLSRRIIYLRPGETRQIKCGQPKPRHISKFVIRPGELLIVLCGSIWHRFTFACGFPRRVRVVLVKKNRLLNVSCKSHSD